MPTLPTILPSQRYFFATLSLKSVLISTTMAQSQISINDRIAEILESIKDIITPNFKQLAREHGVPYQRLLARSKGVRDTM